MDAPANQRRVLPTYLRGFATPGPSGSEGSIRIYRPSIGEWREAPLAAATPGQRHFNDSPDTSGRWLEMARALVAAAASVLPLLVDAAEARLPLRDGIRHTAASFLALMGVLRAPGFDALSEVEAETSVARLVRYRQVLPGSRERRDFLTSCDL